MSERGLPIADSANACPFVAFEDDRDERATVPDHRHRCYAEVRPAPRALAHQEAYCLSSAFPVCPTFQEWARREAARARDAAAGAGAGAAAAGPRAETVPATGATPSVGEDASSEHDVGLPDAAAAAAVAAGGATDAPDLFTDDREPSGRDDDDHPDREPAPDDGPRRNPPRDWSAPPPWLASAEAGHRVPAEPPDFLAGRSDPARGLAGSAADLLAGGSPPRPVPASRPAPAFDAAPRPPADQALEEEELPQPAVPPRRPRAYDQHLGGPSTGPDWERPRRYEAYPTIKTRMGLPSIPRLPGLAAAVALAAVALFFLGPPLLGIGSDDTPDASVRPSPSPTRSIAPTPTPAPTPIAYIIKKGDTLSKIAIAHGITIEELLAANPTIKNADRITEGQQITIPVPSPEVPDEFGGSAAPSAEGSP